MPKRRVSSMLRSAVIRKPSNNHLESRMMQVPNRKRAVAVAFLATDVNRFSINALTGAMEQDETLQVTLSFPHPRNAQTEIERLLAVADTVVVACSFMSSALLSTMQFLEQLKTHF